MSTVKEPQPVKDSQPEYSKRTTTRVQQKKQTHSMQRSHRVLQ